MSAGEEDRIALEDMNLVLATDYHNEPAPENLVLFPGIEPFVVFQLKQQGGAIVADITASLIADDQDLIETLEVFLTALVEERAARLGALQAQVDVALNPELDENDGTAGYDDHEAWED